MKSRGATVMGVTSIVACPLKSDVSGTAHWAPIILRASNCSIFREQSTKRPDGCATMDMCILGSLIFIEHIINPVQHRTRIARRSTTAASRSEEAEACSLIGNRSC
jgi:hypothetical protein